MLREGGDVLQEPTCERRIQVSHGIRRTRCARNVVRKSDQKLRCEGSRRPLSSPFWISREAIASRASPLPLLLIQKAERQADNLAGADLEPAGANGLLNDSSR